MGRMTITQDTEGLITRGEAADLLGVTVRTVSRYMDNGRLHKYKGGALGRLVRLSREDVERFLREEMTQPFREVPARGDAS